VRCDGLPYGKSNLSRLVAAEESGIEAEIIIARNGRPAARLVAVRSQVQGKRIGLAEGEFTVPEDTDIRNPTIDDLLAGRIR
jgi:antitoxin (DNA-binding transcriptional repressor) of toxin-antitoxin stability system